MSRPVPTLPNSNESVGIGWPLWVGALVVLYCCCAACGLERE